MKTLKLVIILAALCLGAVACRSTDYDYLAMPNGSQLKVELAATPAARIAGLSGREFLADGAGMLFLYPSARQVSFWMKDMKFNLDLIFFDEQLVVLETKTNAEPCNQDECPKIKSASDLVKYVLEIPAGQADYLGLVPGASVKLFE